ncbi:MAG: DUF3883 domain-containing protein, partial [Candidatus Borkfalkiaceae bacterium]|nr:DUF3883 domain-containing protein [Christensenellaceae bacterium]
NENIEKFIVLFGQLGIDIDKYNVAAVHSIDTTKYWLTKLRSKMMRYLKQYQAYIINDLQDENDCIKLYSQYLEEYRYLEPTIRNSLFVNIDDIFERECGVSFDDLDDYSESTIDELIKTEKSKLSETDLLRLPTLGSPQIVEAYLIFGRISELLNPVDETQEANHLESQPAVDDGLEQLVHSVFSMQTDGFTDVSMQAVEDSHSNGDEARPHKPIKRVHSELSDKKKQEIGMVGEAFVYKTLLEMDPGALWVSGNAEKAGQIPRGDDTCGYDIKYTDANGNIQYVEVKASRSEEISFCISDNELRFGCKNASCYEIIYVVIGEDGLPAHKPWRLGHLFEFEDGEELFNNERFSVESDSYRVVAKRIEKPQE